MILKKLFCLDKEVDGLSRSLDKNCLDWKSFLVSVFVCVHGNFMTQYFDWCFPAPKPFEILFDPPPGGGYIGRSFFAKLATQLQPKFLFILAIVVQICKGVWNEKINEFQFFLQKESYLFNEHLTRGFIFSVHKSFVLRSVRIPQVKAKCCYVMKMTMNWRWPLLKMTLK